VHLLLRLAVSWGVNVAALFVADWLFGSVELADRKSLLVAAAVLGVVTAVLRPILRLLAMPLIILTLGLFTILIDVAILGITDRLVDGFEIGGFWTYVGAAIVIGLVNTVLGWVLPDSVKKRR
jgi:putative membrane protein